MVIPQGNVRAYNFVASAIYTVSGTVSGDVQEGVTITLSGDSSATTITASDGTYSFTGLLSGSYAITPRLINYFFNPVRTEVPITDVDVIDVDFSSMVAETCGEVDRFLDMRDDTIIDCRTGLLWLKNANCYGMQTWDADLGCSHVTSSWT